VVPGDGRQGRAAHAICYNYRQKRYWIEEYPTPISASCVATIGYRRSLAGTEARRVLCLAEGALDGVEGGGDPARDRDVGHRRPRWSTRGPASPALEGAPVAIVDGLGPGADQRRRLQRRDRADAPRRVGDDPRRDQRLPGRRDRLDWRSGWFRISDDQAREPPRRRDRLPAARGADHARPAAVLRPRGRAEGVGLQRRRRRQEARQGLALHRVPPGHPEGLRDPAHHRPRATATRAAISTCRSSCPASRPGSRFASTKSSSPARGASHEPRTGLRYPEHDVPPSSSRRGTWKIARRSSAPGQRAEVRDVSAGGRRPRRGRPGLGVPSIEARLGMGR
jgi:hypothetical protein